MASEENPNGKVTSLCFFILLCVSFVIFFIILFGVSLFLKIQMDFIIFLFFVLVLYLSLQFLIHILDVYNEHKASQSDWKKSTIPKNVYCPHVFEIPQSIQKIFVKIKGEILEPFFLYASIFDFPIVKKGWNIAVDNPEFNSCNDHDAIIVMAYSPYCPEYFSISGLDLILQFFIEKKINYRVYSCDNLGNFVKIINNPRASSLWILGHGCRGGIRINDEVVNYSDIVVQLSEDAKNKKYVYQLHCNSGDEPSLSDLISKGRGFANYQRQFPYTIRGYLANIFRDEQWNPESSTITSPC
jgi:hypothetical protein